MLNFEEFYKKEVKEELFKTNSFKNKMSIPGISKVTLNMGVGKAVFDKKHLTTAVKQLTDIAGQKAVGTKAKKSIAGFKIREGWPIGAKVTLRKKRMYDFLDRLLHIVIPRIRDFRGLNPRSFDGNGNFSFGIKEQIIFPEIEYDKIDEIIGLDICVTTTAQNDADGLALLKAMRFPFKEVKGKQKEGSK